MSANVDTYLFRSAHVKARLQLQASWQRRLGDTDTWMRPQTRTCLDPVCIPLTRLLALTLRPRARRPSTLCPSSVGMSGADLRDRALNIPGSEGTSKYEVLCSDIQLNEANSINVTPTSFLQVSIRSKRNLASFPDAPVQSALTFVDSTSLVKDEIPSWLPPTQSRELTYNVWVDL